MPALFLAAIAVYAMLSGPAIGQQACADRGQLLGILGRNYGEQLILWAMDAGGVVIEMIASPRGMWSLLVTRPGGPTCMRGSGEAFEFTLWQTAQPGSPS